MTLCWVIFKWYLSTKKIYDSKNIKKKICTAKNLNRSLYTFEGLIDLNFIITWKYFDGAAYIKRSVLANKKGCVKMKNTNLNDVIVNVNVSSNINMLLKPSHIYKYTKYFQNIKLEWNMKQTEIGWGFL